MADDAYDVLDLKALRCFWAMARYGSLTRAGIELGISESAVSQRLRTLESRLHRKLYESRGGRVRLTDAGEQTLAFAEAVFEELDAFEASIASGEVAGTLEIAAYESVLRYLLPDVVRRFRTRHPRAFLRLLSRNRAEVVSAVQKNQIDAGVVADGPLPQELRFIPWLECGSMLLIPKGHPLVRNGIPSFESLLEPETLERYPLIESSVGSAYTEDDRIARVLDSRGLPHKVAFEVGNIDTVRHYVALGLGIAVVPEHCVDEDGEQPYVCLRVPEKLHGDARYGVLVHRRKHLSSLLRAFLACMDVCPPAADRVDRQ